MLTRDANEAANVWRLAFSNHDIRRTATRFAPDAADTEPVAALAMALLLSLRGTPCIYQGEELGLTEVDVPYEKLVDPYGIAFWPKFKGRDGCRTPMPWAHDQPHAGFSDSPGEPWLPIPEEHRSMAADVQTSRTDTLFHLTRNLISLHQNHPAFHTDHLQVLESPEDLLVFERGEGESKVLCVSIFLQIKLSFKAPKHRYMLR